MSIHLQMLPPSVNNLTVRVFLRAAGLEHTEENAWGNTRSEGFLAMNDTPLPAWAHEYRKRVEGTLGAAYAEPAADVRGFVAQAKAA